MKIKVVEKPRYYDLMELNSLSDDELVFVELYNQINSTTLVDLSYHPKAFGEPNGESNNYSYVTYLLGGDFEISIYFLKGKYDAWIFKNNLDKERSGDKDRGNPEKAKEKIIYILKQYMTYRDARFNICKYTDNYNF